MDQLPDGLKSAIQGLQIPLKDYKKIHPPSFFLGCLVTISLTLLEPVLRALVGGIVISILRLVKFAVLIGGLYLCATVIFSKDSAPQPKKLAQLFNKSESQVRFAPTPKNDFVNNADRAIETDNFVVAREDVRKHGRRGYVEDESPERDAAYERFIRKAGSGGRKQ
ncbi:LAMI_0F09450g1_1 [Lachancea mirantina]|uniref:LAMI_0F09450g1_1 n=1 Tax=Lachancea mirantina TaxID=1230905 RepID=A0A1G4K1B6_9SACH|nr:LAMI_0F09450g1_1 [Lachancea mirantina]